MACGGRLLKLPLLSLLLPALLALPVSSEDALEATRPKYERVGGSVETVWQRPAGEPRGIVFIAHGCMHQGTDIFSEVGPDGWHFEACALSNFRRCLGLPEEVRLRHAARARGYLVMAVSGGKGVQSCWNMQEDTSRVAKAIEHIRQAEALPDALPVFAIGASSGGAFVGRLAAPLSQGGLPNLQCIVPQIMGVGGVKNRGVPTLFVHMPKDKRTAGRVEEDLAELRNDGVRAEELRVEQKPITAALLEGCLNPEVAAEVAQAVRQANLLDEGGYLKKDARSRLWVLPVRRALAGRSDDSLAPDESCLGELFNVAWAFHEFTSEHAEQMLDFCERAAPAGAGGAALPAGGAAGGSAAPKAWRRKAAEGLHP